MTTSKRRALRLIRPDRWNRVVGELAKKLNLTCSTRESGTPWRHPWDTAAIWSPSDRVWKLNTYPGYINAAETETSSLPARRAPAPTLARLGIRNTRSSVPVVPWLSERPWLPVTDWRAIGTDAEPGVTPEAVPEFFTARGVEAGTVVDVDAIEQTISVTQGTTVPPAQRRLLRAVDVVIRVPKPTLQIELTSDEAGGSTFFIGGERPGGNPVLTVRRRYEPQLPPPSLEEQLLTGRVDDPYTESLVATVYLLSPPGTQPGADVSAKWQPYTRHSLFWNRGYAYEIIKRVVPALDQSFGIPLAGGIGNSLIDSFLADLNERDRELSLLISSGQVRTDFWTV